MRLLPTHFLPLVLIRRRQQVMAVAVLLIFFQVQLFAQPTENLKQWLLDELQQEQVKESSVFPSGSFPSWRRYAFNGNVEKADINPFFTGLIDFTLLHVSPHLNAAQQLQVQRIRDNCQQIYPKFANRSGRPTYNFWTTDTPRIFPNGGWLNWFNRKQALPDDADDTVILLMAQQRNDSVARSVHKLLREYANGRQQTIRNTYNQFRQLPAYSTWFGKKMPVDFDICVMTNILYFVQHYQLTWNDADSASLQWMEQIIANDDYLKNPAYVSPHYQRVPVILYHLARLMELKSIPALEKHKTKLVQEAIQQLSQTKNILDAVILHTALLRWGFDYNRQQTMEFKDWARQLKVGPFDFFVANMSSMLPGALKSSLDKAALGKFYYLCPGYHYALVLENLIWQEKIKNVKQLSP
jgi:hypothetical protein